jgi:hypothetical protein
MDVPRSRDRVWSDVRLIGRGRGNGTAAAIASRSMTFHWQIR